MDYPHTAILLIDVMTINVKPFPHFLLSRCCLLKFFELNWGFQSLCLSPIVAQHKFVDWAWNIVLIEISILLFFSLIAQQKDKTCPKHFFLLWMIVRSIGDWCCLFHLFIQNLQILSVSAYSTSWLWWLQNILFLLNLVEIILSCCWIGLFVINSWINSILGVDYSIRFYNRRYKYLCHC